MAVVSYDKLILDIEARTNKVLQGMKPVDKILKDIDKQLEKVNMQKRRFDMNVLSWLFGGIALQRMGMTIMRFLIPSMDMLEKINDRAAKKTMGVAAAFEYMKISIFETLVNTPLFQNFIEAAVKFFIWIADLAQQHPLLVEIAAVLGGIALTLGSIAIGVGIFGQLEHLMVLLGLGNGVAGAAGVAKTAIAAIDTISLSTIAGVLGGLAVSAGLIYTSIKLGQAMVNQLDEPGRMKASDVALGPITNLDKVQQGVELTDQKFSMLNNGMQSTIRVINDVNETTGQLSSHIYTTSDATQAAINSGTEYIKTNGGIKLSAEEIIKMHNSVAEAVDKERRAYESLQKARAFYSKLKNNGEMSIDPTKANVSSNNEPDYSYYGR